MHPIKQAVCEEILNLLNDYDSTVRKDTINSLRRPRYFYSRVEKAQIDYFIDQNDEFLRKLIDRLCQLITDISPEVQKAALTTLTVFQNYRWVNKMVRSKRNEVIMSTTDLLREKDLKAEVIISAAKLLMKYKASGSYKALEEALNKFQETNSPNVKVERIVTKAIKSLQ